MNWSFNRYEFSIDEVVLYERQVENCYEYRKGISGK